MALYGRASAPHRARRSLLLTAAHKVPAISGLTRVAGPPTCDRVPPVSPRCGLSAAEVRSRAPKNQQRVARAPASSGKSSVSVQRFQTAPNLVPAGLPYCLSLGTHLGSARNEI